MNIYISHSTSFDYKKELYQPLESIINDHNLILPHNHSADAYPTKQYFQSGACNLVLAEVSYPSTGQGIELGWADLFNIPILCIYKKGKKVSGAINTVANRLIEYETLEKIIPIINN